MRLLFCLLLLSGLLSGSATLAADAKANQPTPEQLDFFERRVRPILIENCIQCHGEKKQSGSLRLDSRKTILEGGDTGPAAIPGNAEKSLLILAVKHLHEYKMPPKGKLPEEQIEILTEWVKQGLPYPEAKILTKAELYAEAKKHWAYQAPKAHTPPSRPEANPIDRFVRAKLESAGLQPNPVADKVTILRRLYFTLTGLPPRPEEVQAFLDDKRPNAVEHVIEQLLASPHYGERWGRYWLDFARYADTKGYLAGGVDRNYPYAYTYRDWVVKAFQNDMPYDQFARLQLAADAFTRPEAPADLAAMGFLTVGRRFLGNNNDIIDDRIDVTMRTFQGLTVACARCHDHKYDPISTKDYYAMYGIFASSREPEELPLLEEAKGSPDFQAYEVELKKREAAVQEFLNEQYGKIRQKLAKPETVKKYLLAEKEFRGKAAKDIQGVARSRDLVTAVVLRYREVLARAENKKAFQLWNSLVALPKEDFAAKANALIEAGVKGKETGLFHKLLASKRPATIEEAAEVLANLLVSTAAVKEPGEEQKQWQKIWSGPAGLQDWKDADLQAHLGQGDRDKLNRTKGRVEQLKATHPGAPSRAMVMVDGPNPGDHRVLVRGNPGSPGEVAPRKFLEVLSPPDAPKFNQGSGRKQLAEAITDPKNPLFARVMVNRVWALHFGQGLVRTPSDFGIRSDAPTHPELLDYLALEFQKSGYSVKKLHRLILTSQTFQQSSQRSETQLKNDPENRWLSYMNRRRLDLESLRDSILAVSEQLDRKVGGKPVEIFAGKGPNRRTIYGRIDRQNLPGILRYFDFAVPDSHSPQRFQTTVPQQALYLMNSPFLQDQARALLQTSAVVREDQPNAKLVALIRQVYSAEVSTQELAFLQNFMPQSAKKVKWALLPSAAAIVEEDSWFTLAQALLLSNRFSFVD